MGRRVASAGECLLAVSGEGLLPTSESALADAEVVGADVVYRLVGGSFAAFGLIALALAGTWMTSTGLLLTENLALPLATASLAAMVVALQRPGSRWPWVALGLAAAATFTRLQLVVLVLLLLSALAAPLIAPHDPIEQFRRDARTLREVIYCGDGDVPAGMHGY